MTVLCNSHACRAPIVWALTEKERRRIPLDGEEGSPDPAPNPSRSKKGRVQLAYRETNLLDDEDLIVVRILTEDEDPDPELPVWRSHFATCPRAREFRR